MPGGDRTGPLGRGPMTGRGLGYCARFLFPGFLSRGRGLGLGFGRRPRNRSFGWRWLANPTRWIGGRRRLG